MVGTEIPRIRVALGTASIVGLSRAKLAIAPTTAHLMTSGNCRFDCAYCAQARTSTSNPDQLSRVAWPEANFETVLARLAEHSTHFQRVCIQCTMTGQAHEAALAILRHLKQQLELPISIDIRATTMEQIAQLVNAGADRIGLPLEAANEDLFRVYRGGSFQKHLTLLEQAARKFPERITTHLIIGLGEMEQQAIELLRKLHHWGLCVGLFAFTPVKGTRLEANPPPSIPSYRRVQAAFHLLSHNDDVEFKYDDGGRLCDFGVRPQDLAAALSPTAFRTTGCPGCNRPFYNEPPRGPYFNYPRALTQEEYEEAIDQCLRYEDVT